jgi:hypothetical protein
MTAMAAVNEERTWVSAAQALAVLAGELGHAGEACQRLDGALGGLLHLVAPEERMKVMQELHAVDLLNQHLAALGALARHLGDQPEAGGLLDLSEALQGLTLGEVARRIQIAAGGDTAVIPDEDEGDLDLF